MLRLLRVAVVCLGVASLAPAEDLLPTDRLRPGDEADATAHGTVLHGAWARGRYAVPVGRLRFESPALVLGEPPAAVEATLRGRTPGARRTLLIRELHLDRDPIGGLPADPRDPFIARTTGEGLFWLHLEGAGPWIQSLSLPPGAADLQGVLVRLRKTGFIEERFRDVRLRCRVLDADGVAVAGTSLAAVEIEGDGAWTRFPFVTDAPAARAARLEWSMTGPSPDPANYLQIEVFQNGFPKEGRLTGPGVPSSSASLHLVLGPRHAIAYDVAVRRGGGDADVVSVARRSITDRGAGPYAVLVDLPSDPDGAACAVRIANAAPGSSQRLVLSEIALYENLDERLSALDAPFLIALQGGVCDSEAEAASLRTALAEVPERKEAGALGGNGVRRAVAIEVPCAKRSAEEIAAGLRKLAAWTAEERLPLALYFTTFWSGTPARIQDGEGGVFGDPRYQQVVFSPTDGIPDTAPLGGIYAGDVRFGLSVPGGWGAPWLSLNAPRLNAHRVRRIEETVRFLNTLAPPNLVLLGGDNEPWYWGSQMYAMDRFEQANGGRLRHSAVADVGPDAVAAAARDGVRLDPRDGTAPEERAWLQKNIADYQALTTGAIRKALTLDVPVFTQSMTPPGYPLRDPCRPVMETGIVGEGVHTGLESVVYVPDPPEAYPQWAADDRPYLERLFGFESRIADLNFETTMTRPDQLERALRILYEAGGTFVALYNVHGPPERWASMREAIDRFKKGLDAEVVRKRRRSLFLLSLNRAP